MTPPTEIELSEAEEGPLYLVELLDGRQTVGSIQEADLAGMPGLRVWAPFSRTPSNHWQFIPEHYIARVVLVPKEREADVRLWPGSPGEFPYVLGVDLLREPPDDQPWPGYPAPEVQ